MEIGLLACGSCFIFSSDKNRLHANWVLLMTQSFFYSHDEVNLVLIHFDFLHPSRCVYVVEDIYKLYSIAKFRFYGKEKVNCICVINN